MGKKNIRKPATKGVVSVPVVMQMEALECGAACLSMVLAYYGKWIPLEQARRDCGVSRDGSKAGNVARAGRKYGMQVRGYQYEPETLKEKGTFPCIIHWNFNHFVVLRGFRKGRAYLNDPARGDYSVTMEVFDDSFTGVVLFLEPGEEFEPGGQPRSMWGYALSRLQGAQSAVVFVAITTLIAAMTGIVSSGFSRVFLDQLLTGQDPGWVTPFFIGMALLTAIQVVSAWIQAIYSLRLNGKMAVVGNSTYMWKVLKLPMEFFSQRMAGDIQSRKEANASISGEMVDTLAPLVLDTLMLFFYLVVMVRYSMLLTAVGLLSVIGQLLASHYITRKRINISRVMMRDAGKLSSTTVSGMEMIETIKSSGSENGFFEKWSGYQASVNTQNVRFDRINAYLGLIPSMLSGLLSALVLVMGVWLAMRGEFTVGMIMAFQGFLQQFLAPATKLISSGQRLLEMRTSMERIEDVMEYPEDPVFREETGEENGEKTGEEDGEGSYAKLSGQLSMRNVTFGYSRLSPPLIEDFSLDLAPGRSVAFVGFSGCGKSTLARLISGLYQPCSGEILFDGKPLKEISRSVFTGSVAVVDQDIILFEDTIANNIKMWDSSIEDFEMILAARDAQLHEDIMAREGGYQYRLTEGGRDLSGGQRQRMEIARVLAQDPTMIILDEATSALDARTEGQVVRAIRDRGIACIVVAHRLSTIRDCDEIIVLDRGHVVERGTHAQLMEANGLYRQLVTSE